jgi:quaternary ammonium compound-resistance protein SugE
MEMAWIYLVLAGVFEIGWPLGLKLSQVTSNRAVWILAALAAMGLSGLFLWLAQRNIAIGTAYAVWTGIGAAGTFIVGIVFFKDPASALRILSVSLIILGIIGLKLSHA